METNIELTTWQVFYWMVRYRSFTKTARHFRVGTPWVSKRISALEASIRTRLFNRSTRSVTLTEGAQALLPRVENLLESYRLLEEAIGEEEKVAGLIRLTCLPSFADRYLADFVAAFCVRYPDVRFEIDLSNQLVSLTETRMDLAIRVQQPAGAEFVFKKICSNQLVLCASPSYLKKSPKIVQPSDLKRHRLLTMSTYQNCRFGKTQYALSDLVNERTVFCDSGSFLTNLALQHAGVAVRSIWDVQPFLDDERLKQILEKNPLDGFGTLFLVIPQRRFLPFRVRVFMREFESYLKDKKLKVS